MRGHVRRRGGRWAVVVDAPRGPDGRRRQHWHSGFATRKAAEDALPALLTGLAQGTYVEPTKRTLKEYLAQWLEAARPQLAGRTVQRYEEILTKHLVPALGHVRLADLRPLDIQGYYSHALVAGRRVRGKSPGLSPTTVQHHHRLLREALAQAVKWRVLAVNPCEAVEAPRRVKREILALDEGQTHRLLAAVAPTRLGVLVLVAVLTGLRRGELLALRWQDVDLDGGRLRVTRTTEQTEAGGIGFKMPKTEKSRRPVALPNLAVEALRRHQAEQATVRQRIADQYLDHGLVFTKVDGRPRDPADTSKRFREVARRAGFPTLTFHGLRHTHATLLLKAGVGARVVADRLGHSTPAFTLTVYAHVLAGQDVEAAAKLDGALRPLATGDALPMAR